MLIKGLVAAEWGRTAENRRARYYRLTAAGRRHLGQEVESYRRVSLAIDRILQPA
jgi:DNA-binding PadR family transcriptional regulator